MLEAEMRETLLRELDGDEAIADAMHTSLVRLLDEDEYLLEKNVNERSVTHRLAMYMQEQFAGWDVAPVRYVCGMLVCPSDVHRRQVVAASTA